MSEPRTLNGQRVTWSTLGMMATVAAAAIGVMLWLQRGIDATVERHAALPRHAGAAAAADVQRIDSRLQRMDDRLEAVQVQLGTMQGELRQVLAHQSGRR